MEDRITKAAKLIAQYDGTPESAYTILNQIEGILGDITRELATLNQELNAIEGLANYMRGKRNELAHVKAKMRVEEAVVKEMESKRERVDAVINAAFALVNEGISIFGEKDIKRQLDKMNVDLNVSFPFAVIGTILSADDRFKRTGTGLYEYVGEEKKKTIKKISFEK